MNYTNISFSICSDDDEDDDLRFLNGIAEQLDRKKNDEIARNCDENGHVWPSIRIFGNICLKHLRDECYGTYCEFTHNLPTIDLVERALKIASREEIKEAQEHLLLRHDVLMTKFFATFCKHYGREWHIHRESLRLLISVISCHATTPEIYLEEILNGLKISGMPYSTCVEQLIIEINETLNHEEQLELLWQLIVDARNEKADEQLKEFEHVLLGDAVISVTAINKIIEFQLNNEMECLRDVAINLVKKTSVTTFRKIDATLLKRYIWHVGTFDSAASRAIQQRAKQFDVILDN